MNPPDAIFTSGGTPQRIIQVVKYDHIKKRVQVRSHPDSTLRWVNLDKPRLVTR